MMGAKGNDPELPTRVMRGPPLPSVKLAESENGLTVQLTTSEASRIGQALGTAHPLIMGRLAAQLSAMGLEADPEQSLNLGLAFMDALGVENEAQALARARGGVDGKGGHAARACLKLIEIAHSFEGQRA